MTEPSAITPARDLVDDEEADEVIQHLLEAARTALDMDVAFITHLESGVQTFAHLEGDFASFGWERGQSGPAADGYCQYVISGDLPNAIPDARAHPFTRRQPGTAKANIGSYLGVGLTLADGNVYGALCVTSHDPHGLSDQDVAFMKFLAQLVSVEISKYRAEAQSRTFKRATLVNLLQPGAIRIHLQPIVQTRTGRIHGVEALSRFADETLRPGEVFPAAERAGLAVELELAAIRAALDVLPTLPEHVYMSVNASPDTAVDPEFLSMLAGAPLERLVLELTEHVAFTDLPRLTQSLRGLRSLGLRVAVDDTGAGYASLSNLLAISPDVIKLDLALVSGIAADPVRRALARALAGFADECGAALIAEGVETEAELETLRSLGIRLVQGYHLCRPCPAGELDFQGNYCLGDQPAQLVDGQ